MQALQVGPLQRVAKTSLHVLTRAVSRRLTSATATTIAEICLMNKTAVVLPPAVSIFMLLLPFSLTPCAGHGITIRLGPIFLSVSTSNLVIAVLLREDVPR